MKLKKIYSFLLLSLVIMLTGGFTAHAETPYDSAKANFEKVKTHSVQGEKSEGFGNSRINKLVKSQVAAQKGFTTKALDGSTFYEMEPNDYNYNANILNRGDIVLGTFSQFDIDVFRIVIPQPSKIVIAGVMDSSSWSDIGFILEDASGNLIYPEDMIVDDHEMSQLHNLAAGVYYIKALNIGEMVTNDLYALAWDYFEPSTPQDTTPPAAPTIDRVDTNTTIITGTAEPGSTVEVEATGATGFHAMTVADSKGKYYLNIDYPLPVGARITVTAVDAAGNRSVTSYTTVVNVPVKNGWVSENNKWYFYVNGNKKIGWLKQGTTWYFLSYQTGTMATGWIFDGGKWYYLQPSGAMKTGWLFDGGKWYYLASSGDMKTGWLFDGGSWYYLANSGAMQTGWVLSNGKWYYLYSNGKMAHSTKIGTYKLGRDGAWIR